MLMTKNPILGMTSASHTTRATFSQRPRRVASEARAGSGVLAASPRSADWSISRLLLGGSQRLGADAAPYLFAPLCCPARVPRRQSVCCYSNKLALPKRYEARRQCQLVLLPLCFLTEECCGIKQRK